MGATDRQITFLATDFVDPEGSAVNSALALANAVVEALNVRVDLVEVSLVGLKGAASSYFNVFLRRVDEACGLPQAVAHVQIKFGSRVQEMMSQASLDALRRGNRVRNEVTAPDATAPPTSKRSWFARMLRKDRV